MCFCSEALQVSHKRTKNPQGHINTTKKESCKMKALYKTHSSYPEAQGQLQQMTDNAKKNSLVQSSSMKSSTISSQRKYVSLAKKTCYSHFFLGGGGCKRNKISPASKPPVLQNKCNLNKHENKQKGKKTLLYYKTARNKHITKLFILTTNYNIIQFCIKMNLR